MNILYSKILNSIDKEVRNIINEQFNIGKMNLNDNKPKHSNNIFNKEIIDPQKIYDKILHREQVYEYEIQCLSTMISVVIPFSLYDLNQIIKFYTKNYKNESLNWLNVSEITYMRMLFYKSKYNGDISQWDVSNVQTMEGMFAESYFNQDISNWDVSKVNNMYAMFGSTKAFNQDISKWNVSNVNNMRFMFFNSHFNQDISGWNVDNVTDFRDIFKRCPINEEYKPEKFK